MVTDRMILQIYGIFLLDRSPWSFSYGILLFGLLKKMVWMLIRSVAGSLLCEE